jgi:dipeptidyl aminopeptidase/acylaminoacyl peptidase
MSSLFHVLVGRLVTVALFIPLTAGASVTRDRPYALEDYFAREEFVSVVVAPDGRLIAIERKRAATAGENYVAHALSTGDYFSRRSDIWVLDSRTGSVVWRTDGKEGQESSFAPSWSPDSRELGFMQSGPDGRTTMAVWQASSTSLVRLDEIDVDLSVLMTRGVSSAEDVNNLFVWSDDSTLFVTGHGSLPSHPLGETYFREESAKRRATWRGAFSARVWDSESPTLCDRGATLFEVSPDGTRAQPLFRGVIYGVSVAPNGHRLAVVSARAGLSKLRGGAITGPEQGRMGNRNDFGRWRVEIIDRSSSSAAPRVVAMGEGAVAAASLPRWSADASRLAVVLGNEPQSPEIHGDVLIDFAHDTHSHVEAASLVGAEARAAEFATTGNPGLVEQLGGSPRSRLSVDTAWGADRAWSLRGGHVAIANANGWSIVGRKGSERTQGGEPSAVVVVSHDATQRIYTQSQAGVTWVDASNAASGESSVVRVPTGGKLVGVADTGNLIVSGDTEDGTFIWEVSPDATATVLARANEHMASIRSPEHQSVKYSVRGEEREAMLYLPTESHFGSRPPVVVTAYPLGSPWGPHFARSDGEVNAHNAWHWHPMLSAGFAVYVVDFRSPPPTATSSPGYIETPDLVTSEILPAIAALQRLPNVDGHRLGFDGYSYGGYTGLTLLGRTKIFKAISAEVPLGSLTQNLAAAPELRFQDCAPIAGALSGGFEEIELPSGFLRFGGALSSDRTRLVNDSPLFNLEDATTPTLLFAGELDAWGEGTEAIYLMLLRKEVPTQLVTYWGEGHVFQSPGNVKDMITREIAWFTRYMGS